MWITILRGATTSKNAKQIWHASSSIVFMLGPSTVMWKAAPSPGAYSAGIFKETVHAPEPVRWTS